MASIKPKILPAGVNVNDALQDLTVVHAINLERLKASETAIVMDILDDLGLSVQKQLEKIDPTGVGPTYRARRLARLEKTIKATTALHYKKIKSQSASSLAETAKVGAKATANGVNSSLGVSLGATPHRLLYCVSWLERRWCKANRSKPIGTNNLLGRGVTLSGKCGWALLAARHCPPLWRV